MNILLLAYCPRIQIENLKDIKHIEMALNKVICDFENDMISNLENYGNTRMDQ